MKLLKKRRTEMKMSFPSNYNKYDLEPRNEQNVRFILTQAKWDKFTRFCAATLQASLSLLFFLSHFQDTLRCDIVGHRMWFFHGNTHGSVTDLYEAMVTE